MSRDDLGWLCGWGGVPLFAWEQLGFSPNVHYMDPCVIDHVDYWLWKENEHIHISDLRQREGLGPIDDAEIFLLHKLVCEKRWRKCARPF